jgi:hypothetical protein
MIVDDDGVIIDSVLELLLRWIENYHEVDFKESLCVCVCVQPQSRSHDEFHRPIVEGGLSVHRSVLETQCRHVATCMCP